LAAGVLGHELHASGVRDATLVHFALSPDGLDETRLLESAYAPPGRYVGEMMRRLRAMVPAASGYLVANPYLKMTAWLVDALLQRGMAWSPDGPQSVVFVDGGQRPLAYLLTAGAVDDCPPVHLALLSCSDGRIDQRLLAASFGAAERMEVAVVAANMTVREQANDFWALSPALRRAAERATALLEAQPDAAARRRLVHDGERTAVIGYHAGDVLFACQALALEHTSFRSVAVLAMYSDIVAYLAPTLTCLPIQQPAPHRHGYLVADEIALLGDYVTELESGGAAPRLWHLFRPFRDYNRSRHHLREMLAFAFGGPGFVGRVPMSPRPLPRQGVSRGRVVVQFEGGWRLKEFPPERRGELLALLREAGYDPVILGAAEPLAPRVPAVPYTNLADFRALLDSAEALIGGDSFPAHFSQVIGVPTIQLFGSTRPGNSRGAESLRYRYLHHPLGCVPCGRPTVCQLDQGDSCHAQASAHEVLAALRALLPPVARAAAEEK
jgi:hypothetical protein